MTCDDLPTFSEMNCLLEGVRDALIGPDVIGIAGIVISVALTLTAIMAPWVREPDRGVVQ